MSEAMLDPGDPLLIQDSLEVSNDEVLDLSIGDVRQNTTKQSPNRMREAVLVSARSLDHPTSVSPNMFDARYRQSPSPQLSSNKDISAYTP